MALRAAASVQAPIYAIFKNQFSFDFNFDRLYNSRRNSKYNESDEQILIKIRMRSNEKQIPFFP